MILPLFFLHEEYATGGLCVLEIFGLLAKSLFVLEEVGAFFSTLAEGLLS